MKNNFVKKSDNIFYFIFGGEEKHPQLLIWRMKNLFYVTLENSGILLHVFQECVVWGLELPPTKTNQEVLTPVYTKNVVSTSGPSDSKFSKVTDFVDWRNPEFISKGFSKAQSDLWLLPSGSIE